MTQKNRPPLSEEREEEALKSYKWNFDGLIHEFNLLHSRAGHYINVNWMALAAYIPILGVTLANLGLSHLRLFACVYLTVVAVIGLAVTIVSIPGIKHAVATIKRYLQNQQKIRDELGENHSFLSDISLGRIPDPTGNYYEHESSLYFHKLLPYFFIILWLFFIAVALWLYLLP